MSVTTKHSFSTELNPSKSNINSINNANDMLGLPYPQGCIEWYKNGMILAAGGAGPTKAGLANGFEILQFNKSNNNNNNFELKRHSWFNTGPDIVYCIRQHPIYPYQFIAGIGNNLVILEISSYAKPTENNAFRYDWNNILKIKYPRNDPIIRSPINTIYIKSNIESIPLLHEDDPFCVHKIEISPNGKLIASGGTDGIVKLWKYDFIDPNNTLSLIKQINITRQHFIILNRERDKTRESPTEIERLSFSKDNKYLAICNRGFASFIWNIQKQKIETILMEKNNIESYIFKDCVFIDDQNDNKYCIVAVNGKRKNRKSSKKHCYLYQYYIPSEHDDNQQWFRINYCKIIKSDVIRIIADHKTRNIITLIKDGTICIFDGLNLTKLSTFKCNGQFFMDIAISPNLYGNKDNNYTEYLLIVQMYDLLIKPISLKPCSINISNNYCCIPSCKYLIFLSSILVLILAVLMANK